MKPRGIVAILGLLLIVGGVVFGVIGHSVKLGYQTFDCGMAFSSEQTEISESSAQYVADTFSDADPYVPGTVTRACESARKPWLAWSAIGLGAVLVAGSLVVKRQPSSSRT
jgi:hypothetical protein